MVFSIANMEGHLFWRNSFRFREGLLIRDWTVFTKNLSSVWLERTSCSLVGDRTSDLPHAKIRATELGYGKFGLTPCSVVNAQL